MIARRPETLYAGQMSFALKSHRVRSRAVGPFLGCVLVIAGISCSSGNGGSVGNASPQTLVDECNHICDNLSECAVSVQVEFDCHNACGALELVQAGCLQQYAGYLTCLSGASSIECHGNGQYVVISPAECEPQRQTFLNCNPGPSAVAACIALPGNTSCAALGDEQPAFCVGQPVNCTAPSSNPLGIGTYCCP